MTIEKAIERAKKASGTNKTLYRLKLVNIGLKYFASTFNPTFKKEWESVNS